MLQISKRRLFVLAAIVIVAIGIVLAWRMGLVDRLTRPKPMRVTVVGHSWWWEFDYPELGIKTANELHVPVGVEIQLELTSVDVLHTLSIPQLALKADAMRGQLNHARMQVDAAGTLGGQCSVACGTAHTLMQQMVVAETPADFETWVANQQEPAALPQTERQQAGYDLATTVCATCHSLNPAEPRTDLKGPNLAHLMSRSVFAGASFELNPSNLRRWMRDTQAMKTGNDMNVRLPRDDFEGAIEYLLMLK